MSWKISSEDEARLCLVLRCYVEEWGSDNVTVLVPGQWSGVGVGAIGRVRLVYGTEDAIVIRVDCGTTILRYEHKLRDPLLAPHTVHD